MDSRSPSGLQAVLLQHRPQLVRFFRAHGAGDAAEDLLHELWLRVVASPPDGPISQPLAYLYRAANNLIIDRVRSRSRSRRREQDWSEASGEVAEISGVPTPDRALIARDALAKAETVLAALGPRAAAVFRRHRIDGIAQRDIAAEMGISLSTVESDLRKGYRSMIDFRRSLDEV
jgi:RNA polymerase sigma-70 factor (ECF subfamily)